MFKLKNLFILACAALACGNMVACSESKDTPNTAGKLELTVAPTTLTIGEGEFKFTATLDGKDVTDSQFIHFRDAATNKDLTNPYAPEHAGKVSFVAFYQEGDMAAFSAPVECTVNRVGTGGPRRRVLALDFTGANCSACPAMTRMLNNYQKENPDRLIVMGLHGTGYSPADCVVENFNELMLRFGVTGYPSLFVDMLTNKLSASASMLKAAIQSQMDNYWAICGIKIDASKSSGSKLVADVEVEFTEGNDNIRIAAAIIENEVVTPGYSVTVHDHVVREFITDPFGKTIEGGAAPGSKISETFEVDPKSNWKPEDCEIVVYVFYTKDGKQVVNNSRMCAFGESVDYDKE
ncbi:MAG: Omp28-related outer membrane protein [Alistipes sp.]|nr:Omp28-related outer membrane protein [Alistipes sp.]